MTDINGFCRFSAGIENYDRDLKVNKVRRQGSTHWLGSWGPFQLGDMDHRMDSS
jgi:hypothetical protein